MVELGVKQIALRDVDEPLPISHLNRGRLTSREQEGICPQIAFKLELYSSPRLRIWDWPSLPNCVSRLLNRSFFLPVSLQSLD